VRGHIDQEKPSNSLTFSATLKMKIELEFPNTGAPFFTIPPRDIVMRVGDVVPITFSLISDPDQDDTGSLFQIDFGDAKNFIEGKYPSYLISPKSNETDPRIY